jgi:hypothetical protein
MRPLMPGYDRITDRVVSNDLSQDILLVRVTRRVGNTKLSLIMPNKALVDPWPEEFLWRPLKALGVIDVWWSMHRSPERAPWALESVYESADGFRLSQLITREVIADRQAWTTIQKHMFHGFLVGYQEALDEKAKVQAELAASEA